ncbi:acetyl-CoA hydrolase/transferase family protein [Telmatocola sphagniphila]|uniref:Acetyl-CoA hydrolase/transferase family protein n=1 Tax=Telmatocola sphagniphila TaxID=1123043 RepID=A0A8E6EZL3_9BACT|nr:acetyl-CoA hydrolase/transferase C-terminal domain-containing protein [Telmatocola sphagniphila]QVL33596.1 acetyl-CoA hydrolase/transferase family protein [Telmatocola sphagniphila]
MKVNDSLPDQHSIDEALKPIRSGMKIFVHGAAATPSPLLEALARRRDLENVTLYHLHTEGAMPCISPERINNFRSVSFFCGPALREPIQLGIADYIPVFLSDIPQLFTSGQIQLDAALLQLSPVDSHGYCSLGTSVDAARAAADTAPILIAEINSRMPRSHGNTTVEFKKLTTHIKTDRALPQHKVETPSDVQICIAEQVAELIEDGCCLQAGIGSIPDSVLVRLKSKSDLGIHTELMTDKMVELIQSGAVTNRLKGSFHGKSITSFVNGTRKMFDFLHDNPSIELHPSNCTNDTALIRKNDKMIAINSAIQIDLTGQVCADSLGHRIYSGIGGQMDFMRGAALSQGGKAIIALLSTAAKGTQSRIALGLTAGAGVVTTRGHIQWVVTEFGAVNLHGKSIRERGAELIQLAHPDFRGELKQSWQSLRHYVI